MKTLSIKHVLLVAAVAISSLGINAQSPIAVRWDMGQNDAKPGFYSSKLVIKNVSGKPLENVLASLMAQVEREQLDVLLQSVLKST